MFIRHLAFDLLHAEQTIISKNVYGLPLFKLDCSQEKDMFPELYAKKLQRYALSIGGAEIARTYKRPESAPGYVVELFSTVLPSEFRKHSEMQTLTSLHNEDIQRIIKDLTKGCKTAIIPVKDSLCYFLRPSWQLRGTFEQPFAELYSQQVGTTLMHYCTINHTVLNYQLTH